MLSVEDMEYVHEHEVVLVGRPEPGRGANWRVARDTVAVGGNRRNERGQGLSVRPGRDPKGPDKGKVVVGLAGYDLPLGRVFIVGAHGQVAELLSRLLRCRTEGRA